MPVGPRQFLAEASRDNQKSDLPWGCLDFRHTFGSQLAQKGISLYKIAELMGNSPEVCRRHYAALAPEKMHDAVEFGDSPASPTIAESLSSSVVEELLARLAAVERPEQAGPRIRLVR
jgi:hypothetical protein